ncbi:MAG TPA: acyl-CoA dehydrogenase family protein [Acetobacteraceae bacterium]|jgi:acyl-CoA dehydrogenase|nr:acyl-CoA dehydrogenase family protein [Acetobacteraceae bacterium]
MPNDMTACIDAWLKRCADPKLDALQGMAEAGLLAPADSYAAIARTKAALVERTGLPGVAGVWGGRQMVARWFIACFGNDDQRAAWLHRTAAVAISEPRVGAHPKLLTTRAEPDGEGFRISGEKAWVSNGPLADVFVVLAITAEEQGRKRYSALLVPCDAHGVTLKTMPAFDALRPSQHCGLLLEGVHVPRSALLQPKDAAYDTMALPFRDVEDAVGAFSLLGGFRFLLARLASHKTGDDAAASLGAISALVAVFAEAADSVVAALDADALAGKAASLAGLHVLAAEIAVRIRALWPEHDTDAAAYALLRDIDVLLSVAKGPRQARLVRIGRQAG